jgi:hypothetical protein
LGKAPEPASAAKLTRGQIWAALARARRRDIDTKVTRIQNVPGESYWHTLLGGDPNVRALATEAQRRRAQSGACT